MCRGLHCVTSQKALCTQPIHDDEGDCHFEFFPNQDRTFHFSKGQFAGCQKLPTGTDANMALLAGTNLEQLQKGVWEKTHTHTHAHAHAHAHAQTQEIIDNYRQKHGKTVYVLALCANVGDMKLLILSFLWRIPHLFLFFTAI